MADSSNSGGVSFDVDVRAVAAALKATGQSLGDLTPALKSGAKIVQDEWKHRVPFKTGNLRMRGSGTKASSKNNRKYGGPFAEVYVTDRKVPYAGLQEFGGGVLWHNSGPGARAAQTVKNAYTRVQRADGQFRMYKTIPIPGKTHLNRAGSYFLYPAFDHKKAAACAEVDKLVGKIIKDKF